MCIQFMAYLRMTGINTPWWNYFPDQINTDRWVDIKSCEWVKFVSCRFKYVSDIASEHDFLHTEVYTDYPSQLPI